MNSGSLGCGGTDFDLIAVSEVATAGGAPCATGRYPGRCHYCARHTDRRDTMFDTALVLLVIAGLLIVVGISQPLAIRLRLPPSVLLAARFRGADPGRSVVLKLRRCRDRRRVDFCEVGLLERR